MNLAFYTYFYGSDNNVAFKIPVIPSLKYNCYYYTNNKTMIEKIKADNITIYFDPASVGTMKDVSDNEMHQWFSLMDVLLLNEEESIYLTGSVDIERALDYLLDYSEVVVIKRGSLGAIAKTRGFDSISVPAVAASVVDTTGAGDSFAAGFIATYAKTHDLTAALTSGTQIAAGCVAIVGGRPRVGTAI